VRERDLEGHLDAENRGGGGAQPKSAVVVDAGAVEDVTLDPGQGSVARNVPFDPDGGKDPMLKIGYDTLTRR
jgi:hypothetical protein